MKIDMHSREHETVHGTLITTALVLTGAVSAIYGEILSYCRGMHSTPEDLACLSLFDENNNEQLTK